MGSHLINRIYCYRALDTRIEGSSYAHRSHRHTTSSGFFVHPPNARVKHDPLLWDLARGILDGGGFPAVQRGHVDVMGESSEWALPKRREDIVLVICGR